MFVFRADIIAYLVQARGSKTLQSLHHIRNYRRPRSRVYPTCSRKYLHLGIFFFIYTTHGYYLYIYRHNAFKNYILKRWLNRFCIGMWVVKVVKLVPVKSVTVYSMRQCWVMRRLLFDFWLEIVICQGGCDDDLSKCSFAVIRWALMLTDTSYSYKFCNSNISCISITCKIWNYLQANKSTDSTLWRFGSLVFRL